MDGTVVLILLVLVMLVGSYVAGSIPLNVSMSEDKLQKVTVFGAGLLVGTALAVIIPEGVRSLFSERLMPTVVTKDYTAEPPGDHDDLHSVIGISLVLGFVFMLLVDQLSSRYNDQNNPVEKNVTATVGLVVHAAADGIALGAAATTSHADVELIVFLAIMLHKAPAAFGLVTFLMHAGLDRNRIRKHLLIFSCAAPLLALLTYFGIGNESKQTLSDFNATGIAMLFSAGPFVRRLVVEPKELAIQFVLGDTINCKCALHGQMNNGESLAWYQHTASMSYRVYEVSSTYSGYYNTLTIDKVTSKKDNNTVLQCYLLDSNGKFVLKTHEISIRTAIPFVTMSRSPNQLTVGEKVSYTCRGHNLPKYTVLTWYLVSGTKKDWIADGGLNLTTNFTLKKEHVGARLRCEAKAVGYETVVQTVTLRVQEPAGPPTTTPRVPAPPSKIINIDKSNDTKWKKDDMKMEDEFKDDKNKLPTTKTEQNNKMFDVSPKAIAAGVAVTVLVVSLVGTSLFFYTRKQKLKKEALACRQVLYAELDVSQSSTERCLHKEQEYAQVIGVLGDKTWGH